MDASLHRALADALGEDAVREGGMVLAPVSADGVAAALRLAEEHRLPLCLTSGAADPSRAPENGAVLSVARLAAVSVDVRRGIVRAEAGATLAALNAAFVSAGVAVPGLGPHPGSVTVGALVASGEVPRRSLTGIEAVLPGGDAVMLGASVLKDVVGYDVISLLLGSRGRLAAIVAAHLRLVPAGPVVEVAPPAGARDIDEVAIVFDPEGILRAG